MSNSRADKKIIGSSNFSLNSTCEFNFPALTIKIDDRPVFARAGQASHDGGEKAAGKCSPKPFLSNQFFYPQECHCSVSLGLFVNWKFMQSAGARLPGFNFRLFTRSSGFAMPRFDPGTAGEEIQGHSSVPSLPLS